MKTAIITANIGSFDEVIPSVQQGKHPHLILSEENFPLPMPVMTPRMKAQFPRMMAHRLYDLDVMLWHDASIHLTSERYAETMITAMGKADMLILQHPERRTIGEEMDFILELMQSGNAYLNSRYNLEIVKREFENYTAKGISRELPLYATGVFCRRINTRTNRLFENWWIENQYFSGFDQILFSVLASQHTDVKIVSLPFKQIIGPLAVRKKHKQ